MVWTIVKEIVFMAVCWWIFMAIYDRANGVALSTSVKDRGIALLFGSWWVVKIGALLIVLWLLNTFIPFFRM